MPQMSPSAKLGTGAALGAAMLGLLPFGSADGQSRLGMTMEEVTVGLPVGFTNSADLTKKIRVLLPNEVSALAALAKTELVDPKHCEVLVQHAVNQANVAKIRGVPLPKEVTDQWKHIFRNGGTDLTCTGTPRVLRINNAEEYAAVAGAISEASKELKTNLWSRYGFTIVGLRPVGSGQKTSEVARPALK